MSKCGLNNKSNLKQTGVKYLPWEGQCVNQQVNACEFIVFNSVVFVILVTQFRLSTFCNKELK